MRITIGRERRLARGRARFPAWFALLTALAALSACSSDSGQRQEPTTVTIAAPGATRRVAAMGVPGSGRGATPVVETPAPSLEPTVDYPSLDAAAGEVERLIRDRVDLGDTAITMRRDTVTFSYWYAHATAPGWAFRIGVRDTSACPNDAIGNALAAAGWVPTYGYQADGPDGGDMGFVTRSFLCLIQGQWDGGDDSDSTYVPQPGCAVTVTLVPRRSDDVPR